MRRTFMNWGMEKKMTVIFVFLIILPVLFLGYISYHNYSNSLRENTTTYVTKVVEQMVNQMELHVDQMKKITRIPNHTTELQSLLQRSNEIEINNTLYRTNHYMTYRGIQDYMNMLNRIYEGTNSIYIFDNQGRIFFDIKARGVRNDIKERMGEWKQIAREANGSPVLLSTREVTSVIDNKRFVFTVVRDVRDRYSLESVGTVAVDANLSVIEDVVNDLDAETKGQTLILDEENDVVYDSTKQQLTQNVSNDEIVKKAVGRQGVFNMENGGEPFLCVYQLSQETGWKFIVTIPLSELTESVSKNQNVIIAAALAVIVLAMILTVVFSYGLTGPLRKLMSKMRKVEDGDFNVRFHVRYEDEVGRLGRHFNHMLTRVQQLINEVYVTKLIKKEVEMEALQAQINPHFIYNTLESIRMNAEVHDDEETSEMIAILGDMLRYSTHYQNEKTTLQKEIEHLRNYIALMNYRFGSKVTLDVPSADRLEPVQMIKLVLQPIVENAITHGLDADPSHLRISLRFEIREQEGVLFVRDNGRGMTQQRMRQLNQTLKEPLRETPPQEHGIGLRNVNERLRLHYGEGYGLEISDSQPEKGTEIMIRLPYEPD